MRYYEAEEAVHLNAEPWQLELLKVNPDYCSWGPNEDHMMHEGGGWSSRQFFKTWAEFGPWQLNELNECVNFYFSVNRASVQCSTCGGNGYHPEAQHIVNTFYEHQCDEVGVSRALAWNDKITEDELQALIDAGRLPAGTTLGKVNEANGAQRGGFGLTHDGINRSILIAARLKRLGLKQQCDACEGHGITYTEPSAQVSLTLWWLHPRKGCSRGLQIERIEQSDLPAVVEFLRAAAKRNDARFAGIDCIELETK